MFKKKAFPSLFYKIFLWILFFFGLVYDLHKKGGGLKQDSSLEGVIFLLTSALAVASFVVLVEILLKGSLRRWFLTLSAFLFAISFYFFKRAATPLSYDLILNNSDVFFYVGTWKLLGTLAYNLFFASDYFWSVTLAMLVYFSDSWGPPIKWNKNSRVLAVGCAVVIGLVSLVQPYSIDPMTNFFRSAYGFYKPRYNIISAKAQTLELEPLKEVQTKFDPQRRPHIFLVIIESFNSRFVNQRNELGTELTPNFNALTQQGLYFPNYFSNSVQTSKGHFAALCGQITRMDGVAVSSVECYNRRCLPTIMNDMGYQTYFIQADPNYDYDGNRTFITRMAKFQNMPELFQPCHKEAVKCYGLGVHDNYLYWRGFDYLSKVENKSNPFFVVMASIANHMPFKALTREEMILYKDPRTFKQHYLNSLRFTDEAFQVLMEQYKKSRFYENSILIITGDHGFPTGEHGSNHNENYAYQENFGVPLLILDSRVNLKEKYKDLQNNAYSHLNLGPTILDLAGYKGTTDFVARSIFDLPKSDKVYLVQPYSGGYQAVIDWPHKYIFEEFKEREKIFNLETDPGEMSPLTHAQMEPFLERLRAEAAVIYRQQEIYECKKGRTMLSTHNPNKEI